MELSTKLNGFTMFQQNLTYLAHPLVTKSTTSRQPGIRYFSEVCNLDEYSKTPGLGDPNCVCIVLPRFKLRTINSLIIYFSPFDKRWFSYCS